MGGTYACSQTTKPTHLARLGAAASGMENSPSKLPSQWLAVFLWSMLPVVEQVAGLLILNAGELPAEPNHFASPGGEGFKHSELTGQSP